MKIVKKMFMFTNIGLANDRFRPTKKKPAYLIGQFHYSLPIRRSK